jgi:RHS repeat-associated protein
VQQPWFNSKSGGTISSPTRSDSNIPSNNKNNTNNNNQPTLPAISLPKGGGAIRGIGEKFGANPVTGTASVSIPIFTSPGRSGFGPSLSLSYDSGAGNGPFGFGWSLSIPSITRKTDKGLPLYRDAEESDVFILSGSEDLVPVLKKIENEDGTIKFEVDEEPRGHYIVRRYRPRIEGLFARIERWTNKASGDIHWRSISKDNITTLYGKDEKSRISDPNDPLHIFSWLICESYDDKGNAILYRYKEENSQRILPLVNERNRDDTTRSANRYLKRIKYGNKTPHHHRSDEEDLTKRKDWMFEVVFDYGEHYTEDDQGQPTNVFLEDDQLEEWHVRPDPFSTYRSGFEVRTYRLCQRVLMFHHFPAELDVDDYLVRATALTYDESPIASFISSITQSGYRRLEDGSYLKKSLPPVEFEYSKATINEEIKEIDSESLQNLPYGIDGMRYQWVDLECEGFSGILTEQGGAWFYKPNLGGGKFGPIERVAFKPTIGSLNSPEHKLIDLAGDGQLDLVELSNGTPGFYERNHDQNWESFVPFKSLPNLNWNDPKLRFVDLTGDGRADILVTENEALTWYPSLAERGFGTSSSSAAVNNLLESRDEEHGPRLVFSDSTQSIYLADMSGDGLTDLVRIRNGEVCYWPNLGYGRFGSKVTMDNSPWFDAPDMFDQSRIRLADIDGSSVTDIIYIGRDDGVRLYFNESGNRWAEPVLLNHFPHIDNISSVTALDLLGNGTACLVWSSPLIGDMHRPMRYVDLMGSQIEAEEQKEEGEEEGLIRGRGKPHLLISIKNNMGAETQVDYASSTKFYLADKAAGKPWITKLPFPVHVVERVKTYDHISRNFFVSHYTYHHGYFDGIEREFRGFGMVEQYDTEEFGTFSSESERILPLEGENVDTNFHVPPVLTKTWFHTGIYLGRDHVSNFFAGQLDKHDKGEYYREPAWENDDEEAKKHVLDDTMLPPGRFTVEEEREACRALKGSMLRQEVYALDETDKAQHPYVVTEQNFSICMLQPQGNGKDDKNGHAVFFTHSHEAITHQYERNPTDPRISHAMTIEVDNFGNVLKQVSIGYGRRKPVPNPNNRLLTADISKQTKRLITYTENRVTNAIDLSDDYRTPMPCESRTYELTGRGYRPTGPAGRFQFTDLVRRDLDNPNSFILKFNRELNYENHPSTTTNSGRQRRLIEQMRTLYRKNNLTDLLRLGELDSLALPGESYKLAFTSGLISKVFRRDGQPLLPDDPTHPNDVNKVFGGQGGDRGGYVSSQQRKADGKFPDTDPDKHWWIPTGRVFYSTRSGDDAAVELELARRHFFLPHRFRDPFGKNTIVAYDSDDETTNQQQRNYNLLLTETRDAVGNRVNAVNDYRVLQPLLVTDPNRNRMEVAFDTLGMVAGSAVKGKDDTVGDNLSDGFEADLSEAEVNEFFNAPDPHVLAPTFLKGATTRIIYDLHCFLRTQKADPDDPKQWLPAYAATLSRETHVSDPLLPPPPADDLKIQISFSYSDGFGREIQKNIQAEPGRLVEDGPVVSPRWVGSGWTIFNNKGKPVQQYEPFFDDTHKFKFGKKVGVTPILFYDPVERVVVTLHPNHTYEKVVFDPWQQLTYDVNDTVAAHGMQTGDPRTDPDIHGFVAKYFATLSEDPTTPPWQTWLEQRQDGDKGPEEQDAAEKAAVHANTPTTVYFDSLGRPFLIMAHNGFKPDETPDQYPTRIELDIEGNQRAVRDAIVQAGDELGRIVMLYDYDMLGNRIHQLSMEAGERWMLNDVTGKPIRAWDSRGHDLRFEYDQLRRPVRSFVTGAKPSDLSQELLTERIVYGEQHPEDELRNLRGKLYLQLDQAGVTRTESYDFKGNPLRTSREIAKQYKQAVDWRVVDRDDLAELEEALEEADPPLLEDETFTSRTSYDALNRPVQIIAPRSDQPDAKRNIIQPVYNDANLLEQVHLWLDHPTEPEGLLDPANVPPSPVGVNNIDYDAKGQRKRIDYKNGTISLYGYDEETFRLVHLLTVRDAMTFPDDCQEPPPTGWEGCQVQNLHYTYDPVGNVTKIRDAAQQIIFFHNQRVEPNAEYTYDAVYRLIKATGREHLGQVAGAPIPHSYNDAPRVGLLHPNDGRLMGTYEERYLYDAVGNLLEMHHEGTEPSHPGWTRNYAYSEKSLIEDGNGDTLEKTSNRLSSTRVDGDNPPVHKYAYDNHGNMTQMPQLQIMQYDFKDQLRMTQRQKVNDEDEDGKRRHGERTYYVYDSTGQRTRKITELPSGKLKDERIYLGQFEIYHQHSGAHIGLVRETLHIMDDEERIALVETRNDIDDDTPKQLIRYQFSNHLGSALLELDEEARIISYEEYFPYGSTSYQAVRSRVEVPRKRYRYTGKERDEESGFYYHGSRYYIPWLERWTNCDRSGLNGGINLYEYAQDNPVRLTDPSGLAPVNAQSSTDWEKERRKHTKKKARILKREVKHANKKGLTPDPVQERIKAEKSAGTRTQTPIYGHHHYDIDAAKRLEESGEAVDPKVVGDPKRMTSLYSEEHDRMTGSINGKELTHHNVAAELDEIEKSKVPNTSAGHAAAADASKARLPATVDMEERAKMDWTRTVPEGPPVDEKTGLVIKGGMTAQWSWKGYGRNVGFGVAGLVLHAVAGHYIEDWVESNLQDRLKHLIEANFEKGISNFVNDKIIKALLEARPNEPVYAIMHFTVLTQIMIVPETHARVSTLPALFYTGTTISTSPVTERGYRTERIVDQRNEYEDFTVSIQINQVKNH